MGDRWHPEIQWIGFDLDDTLHLYRKASGRAAAAAFEYLNDEFGCDLGLLKDRYADILRKAQRGSFTEGKASRVLRGERFGALMAEFSILPQHHLDRVLDTYDDALSRHLELKEGALEVLSVLKQSGFSIMVVSEGPQDAQETTLARLGLAPHVDLLITSGQERRSKREGLLKAALAKAGCPPESSVFIGDNMECDILPALALGMKAFYVGEDIQMPAGTKQLSSLADLLRFLS
jgi:putative hydrolase of the HAD superfamily